MNQTDLSSFTVAIFPTNCHSFFCCFTIFTILVFCDSDTITLKYSFYAEWIFCFANKMFSNCFQFVIAKLEIAFHKWQEINKHSSLSVKKLKFLVLICRRRPFNCFFFGMRVFMKSLLIKVEDAHVKFSTINHVWDIKTQYVITYNNVWIFFSNKVCKTCQKF